MPSTIIRFAPTIALRPVDRKKNPSQKQAANVPQSARNFELETRLWKVAARPTNRVFATIHLFCFAVFFVAGQAAMMTGFTESSHLLKRDAIGHVAKRAIDGDQK